MGPDDIWLSTGSSPRFLTGPLRTADSDFFLDEVLGFITRTALTYMISLLCCIELHRLVKQGISLLTICGLRLERRKWWYSVEATMQASLIRQYGGPKAFCSLLLSDFKAHPKDQEMQSSQGGTASASISHRDRNFQISGWADMRKQEQDRVGIHQRQILSGNRMEF